MVKDSEFLTLVFQSILDEIDVGLHVVDEHGNTIVYNNKMMQIEDMEKQDVLNKNLMDVFMFSKQRGQHACASPSGRQNDQQCKAKLFQ